MDSPPTSPSLLIEKAACEEHKTDIALDNGNLVKWIFLSLKLQKQPAKEAKHC